MRYSNGHLRRKAGQFLSICYVQTVEQEGKKYHIVGMTSSDETKLYIIEPYMELKSRNRKGTYSHRRMLSAVNLCLSFQFLEKTCGKQPNHTYCDTRRDQYYSHRRMLKEQESLQYSYLHCSDLGLGGEHFKIQGGMGSPMNFDAYGMFQLFFDMMSAVPNYKNIPPV